MLCQHERFAICDSLEVMKIWVALLVSFQELPGCDLNSETGYSV
jgi:hypothetical protein